MGKSFNTGLLTNGIAQDSSNNIGIGGAANASYKLAVTGAGLFSSALTIGSTESTWNLASSNKLQIQNSLLVGYSTTGTFLTMNLNYNSGWKYISTGAASIYSQDTGDHVFFTSVSGTGAAAATLNERLRITNSGNVGIGTTSPSSTLQVSRGGAIFQLTDTNKTNNNTFSIYGFTQTSWAIATGNSGTFSGGEKIIITDSGNVGIANTNPSYKLDIHNGSDFDIRLRDTSLGGTVGILFETANDFSGTSQAYIKGIGAGNSGVSQLIFGTAGASGDTTATERMRITSGGTLNYNIASNTDVADLYHPGISLSNANGGTLYIANNTTASTTIVRFSNPNGQVGSITTSGSSTAYNTSSDYRLKQDLKDYNGLDLVSAIKTYDYEWKSDKTRSFGVIAHELQEIIPQAVYGEKDGEMMQGVDYSKLVPILVKAIKELSAKVTALENK